MEVESEPQAVVEAQLVACREVEEVEAQICRIVEAIVKSSKANQAASDLNMSDQPAQGLMMVASIATEQDDYDPHKAFDLGLDTQPSRREIPIELYNLDDFLKEP
ncbi:hypothetical protein PIB30_065926 [Stylosanthes scabra]|uniref:Uncharacterized protein n=1 Tax=Stylosanthes scabra TaxID=79078 RepID=A0ABU6VP34_9FABA|nr:hypothetical protein [Stylosanthes scabra]